MVYPALEKSARLLRCPLCGGAAALYGGSLQCENKHCFDVARQGYVNLAPGKGGAFYGGDLFENRRAVFGAGFYEPVADLLHGLIKKHAPCAAPVILDAGCGEGYYERALLKAGAGEVIGLDLARDGVRMAAAACKEGTFLVADLERIPLRDAAADVILNILTPASYREFFRVLKKGGVLIKVAPMEDYLKEFRALGGLTGRETGFADVRAHFLKNARLIHEERVLYTLPVEEPEARRFAGMTPMLRHAALDKNVSPIRSVTIDLGVLVGGRPENV